MGQVRQQAVKHTFITLLATGVSALATITIYSRERELYGLLGYLMDTALLFSPFIILSTSASLQRFYPYFEKKNGQNSLFTLGISVIVIGALISIPILYFFKRTVVPLIPSYNEESSAESFFFFILPIAIAYALLNYLFSYASIFKKVAIPVFFQISNKFFTPLIVLLYYLGWIETTMAVYFLISCYFLALLGMIAYQMHLGIIQFAHPKRVFQKIKVKEYVQFSSYSLLTVFGKQLTTRIDGFMVPLMFTVGLNGEYRIAAFIAGIILVPFNSIASLMAPMIASAWKRNDTENINMMYADSSKHSLIIGLYFFLLIYFNLDALLLIMPRGEELLFLKEIFLVIAVARLFDLGAGVNDQIITYSRYFRFNFYLLFFLGLSNVVLNFILAKSYGFIGIAIATSISLIFFNLAKMAFIYYKFELQPIRKETIKLLVLFFVVFTISSYLPGVENPWLEGVLNSSIVTFLFLPLVFLLRISISWNQLLIKKIKGIIP